MGGFQQAAGTSTTQAAIPASTKLVDPETWRTFRVTSTQLINNGQTGSFICSMPPAILLVILTRGLSFCPIIPSFAAEARYQVLAELCSPSPPAAEMALTSLALTPPH